jgi:hypothetical protein
MRQGKSKVGQKRQTELGAHVITPVSYRSMVDKTFRQEITVALHVGVCENLTEENIDGIHFLCAITTESGY